MPKFSIIVPVYNTEKYLEKCLYSVFKQDFKDYEVVVVNDGSTDNSEKIIETYGKKYENLKYFFKENGGLSSARNYGVLKSSGDYLLFLDSDDFYSEGFLKELSKYIYNDVDVVRYQVQDFFDDGNIVAYRDNVFSSLDGISAFNKLRL